MTCPSSLLSLSLSGITAHPPHRQPCSSPGGADGPKHPFLPCTAGINRTTCLICLPQASKPDVVRDAACSPHAGQHHQGHRWWPPLALLSKCLPPTDALFIPSVSFLAYFLLSPSALPGRRFSYTWPRHWALRSLALGPASRTGHILRACPCRGTFASQPSLGSPSAGPCQQLCA